jgi:hypothetical protein
MAIGKMRQNFVRVGGKQSPDERTVLPVLLTGNVSAETIVAGSGVASWDALAEFRIGSKN